MNLNTSETRVKPSLEQAYDRYVSELRHEDSLINNRLMWLLVLEGFFLRAWQADASLVRSFMFLL